MNAKILVTGATGKLGRELVPLLLEAGAEVKAGTRSPRRARDLWGDGSVEVVELDYRRTETYDGAVQWADGVFLVPPPFDPDAYRTLIPFLDWAVGAGVEHVVLLSAMALDRAPEELSLRRVERHVQDQDVEHTLLRPNLYMQNFSPGFLEAQVREEGVFRLPVEDARVSYVDVRDVAAVASLVLTAREHRGRTHTLTGPESLGPHEVARILSEAAGRPVEYRAMDAARFRDRLREDGWPAEKVEVILDLARSVREGVRAEPTGDVARLLGRDPIPFRRFARDHAEAWRATA